MDFYTHKSSKTEARQYRGKKDADELCRHYVVNETSHTCSYNCGDNDSEYGCGCSGVCEYERHYCENAADHEGQHAHHLTDKIVLSWDEE